jgi:hypothetical protein
MTAANARFCNYLDRKHDVLVTLADAAPLHQDLELHLLSIGISHDPRIKSLLQDGLAAMALYLVARPRFDHFGWTIQLKEPLLSLFFAGSAKDHTVVGRAFLEGVKSTETNRLFVQTSRPFGDLQTSSVDVEGDDIFSIVEQYCEKSDQQDVRLFRGEDHKVALVTAFHDADCDWFRDVRGEEVFDLHRDEDVNLIAEKEISFRCGCDRKRITRLVVDIYKGFPEDLFQGETAVEAECPRCGTQHQVTREDFDAVSRQ